MPFRFRKSIKILPGVRINIGKTGISTSFGGKGFTTTIGRGKERTTIGIPGTGVSYSTERRLGSSSAKSIMWIVVVAVIISFILLSS